MGRSTPWGVSDQQRKIAPGIIFYGTPSHGGFHLSSTKNALVHEAWRKSNGWYEEDCEANIVVYTFSTFFDLANRDAVCKSLKNWFPDEYEQVTGERIAPGESLVRDERTFREQHEKDWVVISAVISSAQPTMVECIATRGGARSTYGTNQEEKSFFVPKGEYDQRGPFGFLIDTQRHREFTRG